MSRAAAIQSPLGRLLPASKAALRIGISPDKLRRLIAKGELEVVRTPEGRLSGVYEADLDAWVARRRSRTIAAVQPVDLAVKQLLGGDENVFE